MFGVILEHNLLWSKQIDTVVGRMGRGVSVVKRISKFLSPDVKRQVLNALVLSQLDYCLVVWSSTSVKNLRKLQVAQNRAARCALYSATSMYDSLGWLPIRHRSTYALLIILRNTLVTQVPKWLYDKLYSHFAQHSYQTRSTSEGRFIWERVLFKEQFCTELWLPGTLYQFRLLMKVTKIGLNYCEVAVTLDSQCLFLWFFCQICFFSQWFVHHCSLFLCINVNVYVYVVCMSDPRKNSRCCRRC